MDSVAGRHPRPWLARWFLVRLSDGDNGVEHSDTEDVTVLRDIRYAKESPQQQLDLYLRRTPIGHVSTGTNGGDGKADGKNEARPLLPLVM